MQYYADEVGSIGVPGTNSSFNAVISLRSKEEVETLVAAISRLVNNSVGLFDALQNDNTAWRPILQDIVTINNLSQTFVDLCLDPAGKERTRLLVDSMEHSKRSFGEICVKMNRGGYPSVEEQKQIVIEVQNILIKMASITDEMEEDQIYRILRASKLAFQHVLQLNETKSDFRLDVKENDVKFAVDNLLKNLNNRLNVLPESDLKNDLCFADDAISRYLEPYIIAQRDCIQQLSEESFAIRDEYLHQVIFGIKTVIDLIESTRTKGQCSFQHEQIMKNLDRIAEAVKQGSSAEVVDGARFLVDELMKLKQRASVNEDGGDTNELSDSCDRLKDMTQRLLEATRNALQDKTEEANDNLNSTIEDVRQHVAQVAATEASSAGSNTLRIQLLQAAKSMSNDMNSFVSILSVDQ